jgi:hypothetical protein
MPPIRNIPNEQLRARIRQAARRDETEAFAALVKYFEHV